MPANVAPPDSSAAQLAPPRPASGSRLARSLLGVVLLVVAAAVVVALLPWFAKVDPRVPFAGVRPMLYFTVQSNLLAAVVMVLYAVALLRGREPARAVEYLRGLAVVDLAITGIVYGLLLGGGGDLALHAVTPVLLTAWWIALPPERPVAWFAVPLWLVHPVAWLLVVFGLRAAAADHWVPYSFLDPREAHGWGGVALTCAAVLAVFAVLSVLAVVVGRLATWRGALWRGLAVRRR